MLKTILQFLGVVRGDLSKILAFGEAFAQRLDAHAEHASEDATYHYGQADVHESLADAAVAEAKHAAAVAKNVRGLFAAPAV